MAVKPVSGYTGKMGPGGIPIYTPKPKPIVDKKLSKYFTRKDERKVPKGQYLRFEKGRGYYFGAKPTIRIVKQSGSSQDSQTPGIEAPAQIEERVRRMAQEAFDRERNAVREEADRLKAQAEGRRLGMTAAYEAAAKANAGMGADVQAGWNLAGDTIQGLAQAGTGGISDALAADVATQEQALSRIGAAGSGFDARSQAAVEAYRGGSLPAEYFTRLGGVGRQWMNEAGMALGARGLQEGIAAENTARADIDTDVISQIKELTTGRTKYESDLREQLLAARGDQITAEQEAREFQASLAIKKVQIEQAQQKIDNQFKVALANATTAAERAQVYAWKAEQDNILDTARVGIAQQNADSTRISANASATRAANANNPKAATPATKRIAIKDANKAGAAALDTEIGRITSKMPGMATPEGMTRKDYVQTEKYAKALAAAKKEVSLKYFGSIMYRVINAVGPFLKEVGYTPTQIKRHAFRIASAKVSPSKAWLKSNPGFGIDPDKA